jgi:hypothetical protein
MGWTGPRTGLLKPWMEKVNGLGPHPAACFGVLCWPGDQTSSIAFSLQKKKRTSSLSNYVSVSVRVFVQYPYIVIYSACICGKKNKDQTYYYLYLYKG